MTKEVTEAKETAVAAGGFDYGEDAGGGFEETTAQDLSIPFINILQSNSPECEDGEAKPGQIVNTVTKEIIDGKKGLVVIPCFKDEKWVEWKPRTAGGGLVGSHLPESKFVQDLITKNGNSKIPPVGDDGKRVPFKNGSNDVIETHYMYVLILDDEGTSPMGFGVIPFSSTKIKPFRDWITAMYMLRGKPPIFANRALIKTEKQTANNQTFYNIKIAPFKENWSSSLINPNEERELLLEAKNFKDMVVGGIAKADLNSQRNTDDSSSQTAGRAVNEDSDEAPF